MAQTIGCFEIFRGNAPRFAPSRFFAAFGPYPWVRLVGLPEILATLHLFGSFPSLSALRRLVREELKPAAESVAAQGERLFPGGDWGSCHATQLRSAMTGEPMCLEKAIIVARAAELACRKAAKQFGVPEVDVYRHLSIHASNCVIGGLDEWIACQRWPRRFFAGELKFLEKLERKLRPHPGFDVQEAPETLAPDRAHGFDEAYDLDRFILAAMEGNAITWKNAQLLKSAFAESLGTEVSVTVLSSRTSQIGLHDCNASEAPFIGLTIEEINLFRNDVKLQPLPVSA